MSDTPRTIELSPASKVIEETLQQLVSGDSGQVATMFFDLDDLCPILTPGHLVLLASRPSMGKTALALNILEQVAIDQQIPAAFVSLESKLSALMQRIISCRGRISGQLIQKRMLSDKHYDTIANVSSEIAKAPLHLVSLPKLHIDELPGLAADAVARHGIKVLCIDYVQLITAPGENRTEELSLISRRLKSLAMELNIPIVALCQMNRGWQDTAGYTHTPKDLRGSGSLEDDADVVLFIHREDYYHAGELDYVNTNLAEVTVAKNRNGPTGAIELIFDSHCSRFISKAAISADAF